MDDFYLISVAARMLGMHPQTLRKYERLGLVQPSRTIGSMRLYSRDELERLQGHQAAGRRWRHQPRRRAAAAVDCGGRAADPAADARRGAVSAREARRLSQELDELMRMLGFD